MLVLQPESIEVVDEKVADENLPDVLKERLEKQLEVVHGSAAWLGARQGVPGDVHRRFGHLRERGRERRGSGDRELGASGAPRERRVSALGSKVVSWDLRSQLTEKP